MTDDDQGVGALPTFFRPADLPKLGLSRNQIPALIRTGQIRWVARGLYRTTAAPVTEMETVLLVARLVPAGIVCLLTALRIHGIGTQSPPAVWMALSRKARVPEIRHWRVRFVRWSGASLTYGLDERAEGGVSYRITTPARTIVDCFRYRNKIGLDVALEALADGLRNRKATATQIMRAAEACRASTIIQPYLESLLA